MNIKIGDMVKLNNNENAFDDISLPKYFMRKTIKVKTINMDIKHFGFYSTGSYEGEWVSSFDCIENIKVTSWKNILTQTNKKVINNG